MPKSISSISLFGGQDPARRIAGLPTSRMWSLKAIRRRDSPSTRYIVGMIQKTIRPTRTRSFSTTTQSGGDGPWKRCGPSGKHFRGRVITSWSDPERRGRMGKRDVITLEVLNSADEWVTRDDVKRHRAQTRTASNSRDRSDRRHLPHQPLRRSSACSCCLQQ